MIEENNPGKYNANVPFDFEEMPEYEALDESNDYLIFENKNLSQFGYSYTNLYNGELKNAKDGVRYDVECINNTMLLAQKAVVYENDAEEISALYPSLNINDEKPTSTLFKLAYGFNYTRTYYNIGKTAKYVPFNEITSIPTNYEPTSTFDSEKTMNYYVFYKPATEGEPLFKAGTSLYVRAPFSGSQKYNFYFIDSSNKIFMFDAHDDDTSDNVSYMRGFYIKNDVYSLAICGKYYQSYLYDTTLAMYAEDQAAYEFRRNSLNEHPIENVKYQKDKFTFTTNYDEDRFVVSRVACDKGWSIKAKNNETGEKINIKVYKGNGGFVSFVAPKGNYSYTMTYVTPYLTGTYIVSALSTVGFFTSMLAYHLYVEKKKVHLDKIYREN